MLIELLKMIMISNYLWIKKIEEIIKTRQKVHSFLPYKTKSISIFF